MKKLILYGVLLLNTSGYAQENLSVVSVYTNQGLIAGASIHPIVKLKNTGTTTIHTVAFVCTYNGNLLSYQASNMQMVPQEEQLITLPGSFQLIAGTNELVASLTTINGNANDNNPADNTASQSLTPTVPGFGHVIAVELATSTGCSACPAASVILDSLTEKYPDHIAGISIHGSDPMGLPQYTTEFSPGGYPTMVLERTYVDNYWLEFENSFLYRIHFTPRAVLTNGAIWDPVTRLLQVSVMADFQLNASRDYRISVVLTEDSVTGLGFTYSQLNAYSGSNFYVGGYELLPNPVPYSMMVYNHVARALKPSMRGFDCFPEFISSGEVHTINCSFVLPQSWDENNIRIVSLLVGPDNVVNNAGKTTINEAVTNGFVDGQDMTASTEELAQIDDVFQLNPNPASDQMQINLLLKSESTVSIQIIDALGNIIEAKNYGALNGAQHIESNIASLLPGIYHVQVNLNGTKLIRKIVKV